MEYFVNSTVSKSLTSQLNQYRRELIIEYYCQGWQMYKSALKMLCFYVMEKLMWTGENVYYADIVVPSARIWQLKSFNALYPDFT